MWRTKRLIHQLWWQLVPGVEVSVRWPVGQIVVNHDDPRWQDMGGAVWVDLGQSADPNDHYRPWLEHNVGRQCRDWDWDLRNDDAAQNRLTIKFRRGKEPEALEAAMRWS